MGIAAAGRAACRLADARRCCHSPSCRSFLGCLFAWLCTNWAFLAALESDPLKGSFLAYYVVVLSMNLLPPLSIVCGLGAFTPAFIEALCTRLRHLSSLGPMTREEVIADVRSVALIAVGAAPVYFSALISYQSACAALHTLH